jgi:colicin import membrane protein
MTITAQAPAGTAGREPGPCRYPGCGSPARASDAPGRPPGYCEREVPEDRDGTSVLVRHTALAAFRRRRQLAGQPDDGRPVTAAISRAGAIRDDALAAMSRLGGQLAAALDQLAVLGEQLAAAGDPEAAEAQAEAVRAETAAQLEHARAETAGHAAARHAAGLEAAEARAAADEAVTMMEAQAAALARAEETARAAARELQDERAAHAAELAAARAAAEDAARGREQDRQQHQAALATAAGTVTTLREQLARAEAALDREREQQHETVALLHGLLASRPDSPEPKTAPRRQPAGH